LVYLYADNVTELPKLPEGLKVLYAAKAKNIPDQFKR
jgi:hypothetical protein